MAATTNVKKHVLKLSKVFSEEWAQEKGQRVPAVTQHRQNTVFSLLQLKPNHSNAWELFSSIQSERWEDTHLWFLPSSTESWPLPVCPPPLQTHFPTGITTAPACVGYGAGWQTPVSPASTCSGTGKGCGRREKVGEIGVTFTELDFLLSLHSETPPKDRKKDQRIKLERAASY